MISVNNHFSFRSDSIKLPLEKKKTTVLSFSVERLKHTAAWQRPLNLLRYVRGTGNTLRHFVHFLVGRQTEGAAVGQLHDVDGEAPVSGLVTEAELHLRAAGRQAVLVGAQQEVSGEAGSAGNSTQSYFNFQLQLWEIRPMPLIY